jgi:ABC-type nickel/cobalt efflux system permease component RcnA
MHYLPPRKLAVLLTALTLSGTAWTAVAHPLGNFTVNHFTRIEPDTNRIHLHYVTDLAEIPAFQALQVADADNSGSLSEEESAAWLNKFLSENLAAISLTADGQLLTLQIISKKLTLPPGTAGLPTMRIECDLAADLPVSSNQIRRLRFEDKSQSDRQGWHELLIVPRSGVSVFDSNAFASSITDELRAYPEDLQITPLNERLAQWSMTISEIPPGSKPLLTRAGKPVVAARDRFAELIAAKTITPGFALFALAFAFVLGGAHALSPGHGKTVVGAYLVGTKGTPQHAAFLGLTVTITHTLGVFALGLVTLFASKYILPEKLYPILSLLSGALVLGIGLSLFVQRLRATLGLEGHHHHAHEPADDHSHSHGGPAHSHLPPETNKVTWRNLLALGISGGLLPCPSALVVMLSAITLNRVGFGLLLIVAFSLGLAGVLTGIGLLFVYAGKLMKDKVAGNPLVKVLPVLSALLISAIGAWLTFSAMKAAGIDFSKLLEHNLEITAASSVPYILFAGFVLGLLHAIEADHLAAVTTIVSERKSLLSSSIIGGLWGLGHTISLLLAGIAVLMLKFEISERTERILEFCVGLMLIGLGINAVRKLWRGGSVHVHAHEHGGRTHFHPHIHEAADKNELHTHHGLSLSPRPLLVGMMHGLAGSAGLMLLIVPTISSPILGLAYIAIFGIGSIGGMMLMSSLISLPMHFTAQRFARASFAVRALAALFSVSIGLLIVYEKGIQEGLLR